MASSDRPKRKASAGVRAAVASLTPDDEEAWKRGRELREAFVEPTGKGEEGEEGEGGEEEEAEMEEQKGEEEREEEK
ncbi:MAG: hypothetical protein ABGY24_00085, partial [bacterium]